MRITALGLMFVGSVCAAAGVAIAQSDEIVQVLPRDAIPAIDRPAFEPVAKARAFDPNELMIGLVGSGAQRAYSTWQLDRHEIVNDTFEGRPVAVTWCPLCGTAIVYARTVAGRMLMFGVSGMLYRDALGSRASLHTRRSGLAGTASFRTRRSGGFPVRSTVRSTASGCRLCSIAVTDPCLRRLHGWSAGHRNQWWNFRISGCDPPHNAGYDSESEWIGGADSESG